MINLADAAAIGAARGATFIKLEPDGAGHGPCALLVIGSRREDACRYTVNDTAAKYDASVSRETDDPMEAYADWRAEGPDLPVPHPLRSR
ncbi:MAG TPA: hypothetical protein VJN72_10280 [Gaiellales bacterium]|nr:hypothetical protein [Gaiellales bacterium]